jgi:probable phosphoglycerate mutase
MRRDFSAVTLPEIYVVRACETAWEREGRQAGRLDSPINANGISQAQAVGRVLREILLDRSSVCIEMSPLGRASHTAALLCSLLDLEPSAMQVSPPLIDCHLGSWQGLTIAEIDARYPGARLARERDKWRYAFPGGESYADVHRRVREWLAGRRLAQVTIAVTHLMVSRILQGSYAGATPVEMLRRSHPQGRIYRLCDGQADEIACEAGALQPEALARPQA